MSEIIPGPKRFLENLLLALFAATPEVEKDFEDETLASLIECRDFGPKMDVEGRS